MNKDLIVKKNHWVRSKDGVLGGIFEGLGRSFGFNPNILRGIYLLSVFGFGVGFILYPLFWFFLPREDGLTEYHRTKALGVCLRLSNKTAVELGIVRILFVLSLFASFGATLLIYIALHFLLEDRSSENYS